MSGRMDGCVQVDTCSHFKNFVFKKFHEESEISHGNTGPLNVGQIEVNLLITTFYLSEMDIRILLSAIFQQYIFLHIFNF